MSKYTHDYQNFFLKSEAGQEFLTFIAERISHFHREAENEADSARDNVQRAKGLREVEDHVKAVCLERKPIGAE